MTKNIHLLYMFEITYCLPLNTSVTTDSVSYNEYFLCLKAVVRVLSSIKVLLHRNV